MSEDAGVEIGLIHGSETPGRDEICLADTAARLAIAQINARGGVLGRELIPVPIALADDSASTIEQARDAIGKYRLHTLFMSGDASARRSLIETCRTEHAEVLLWFPSPHEGLEQDRLTIYCGSSPNQRIGSVLQWCRAENLQRIFLLNCRELRSQVYDHIIRAMTDEYDLRLLDSSELEATPDARAGIQQQIRRARPDIVIDTLPADLQAAFHAAGDGNAAADQHHPTYLSLFPAAERYSPQPAGHLACSCFFAQAHQGGDSQALQALGQAGISAEEISETVLKAYYQIHMWHELVEHTQSLQAATLHAAACDRQFGAGAGGIRLSNRHHAYASTLIARKNAQGRYEQIWRTAARLPPQPWLGLEAAEPRVQRRLARLLTSLPTTISQSLQTDHAVQARQLRRSIDALEEEIRRREALETRLQYDAHFDTLTGLPNQRKFLADLRRRRDEAPEPIELACCFLNLDGFKAINARHGEELGDRALRKLAQRLAVFLPPHSHLARWAGDEFVFVLNAPTDCAAILDAAIATLTAPLVLDGNRLTVGASIGASRCQFGIGQEPERLVRQAAHAMYSAKRAGGDRVQWFDHELEASLVLNAQKRLDIRQAIQSNRLRLYYQPKVDMPRARIVGVEALVRCIGRSEDELISPGDFLPFIAGSTVQQELDWWVLETAMRQASLWRKLPGELPISVNINAATLMQENFVSRMTQLAAQYALPAGRMELEILESSEIADLNNINQVIRAAHKAGFHFALDDCGAGYSSLAFIRWLEVDELKIDQSFIRNMLNDREDSKLVKGLIALAAAFDRRIIAEGVETVELGSELIKLGCDRAQGFGIARPMPADQFENWQKNYRFPSAWTALAKTR